MIGNSALFWDFVGLFFSLTAVILSLRILWRVEKRLHKFFKIFTLVFIAVAVRQVLRVLLHTEVVVSGDYLNFLDALPILIAVFALVVMNRLIKDLDGENK